MLSRLRLRLRPRLSSPLTSPNGPFRCSGVTVRYQSTSSPIQNHEATSHKANQDIHKQSVRLKQTNSRVETVVGEIDLELFRKAAWIPETPLLLQSFHGLPAMQKWFQNSPDNSHINFTQYLKAYEDIALPYEFTAPRTYRPDSPSSEDQILTNFLKWLRESHEYRGSCLPVVVEAIIQSSSEEQGPRNSALDFQQLDAPLSLIMSACQFNSTKDNPSERIKNLYVAQSDLSNLPHPLSQDLPVPHIVKYVGKGDIYSSSIWLGLQPTYTPLHRDPNPNLFCQLVGSKRIRLMTPGHGDGVYARVRREINSHGNSRFRGTEMMRGHERELLHRAVWDDGAVDEVFLDAGDALFIPKGWWHSVASSDDDGGLNASVNWWFR